VAFAVYGASAYLVGRTHSPQFAYFDQLADAFLHGRLNLVDPRAQLDLTSFAGKWYVAFPPLPALLLLPWVAARGLAGVNTVLFANIVGAANVSLVFLMLQALSRRGWTQLSLADTLWLTVLFGMGSVHWYMATVGAVWYLGQICAVPFMLLAVWLAVTTGSALLSGGALAVAMLARPHLALCYPLLWAIALERMQGSHPIDWRRWVRWGLVGALPLAAVVLLLLGYNYARFGDPMDFGYLRMKVAGEGVGDRNTSGPLSASEWRTLGQFNVRYAPRNLRVMLLAVPGWNASTRRPALDPRGMSLLLTTPALIYLFRARKRAAFVVGAWLALALLLGPLVTYGSTGWRQFGYRYSLDLMTPVMILLAVAVEHSRRWPMRALIVLGVLVNAWGAYEFRYFSQ